MKTIYFDGNTSLEQPCIATIGFFDGVHRGHVFLLEQLTEQAKTRGILSVVVTFDKHPKQVLRPDNVTKMLNTLDEKTLALSKTGVDLCVVVPFTESLAQMSAYDFMKDVLGRLCAKVLLTGYDNRFGHNRSEGFNEYVDYGRQLGIEVILAKQYLQDGKIINSSLIRKLLDEGQVEEAGKCLGAPYTMTGNVVEGFHIGRSMHFPTANVQIDDIKLLPLRGVYAVKVRLDGTMEYKHGMMNIGNRPTFSGSQTTVEVHIFNCNEYLYGTTITIAVCCRLRDEIKFADKEDLVMQLHKDAEEAEIKLALN